MASIYDIFKSKTLTQFQDISFLTKSTSNSIKRNVKTILTVDATLELNHESELEASEHPVETGGEAADDMDFKPVRLTVRGMISSEPFDYLSTLEGMFVGAGAAAIGTVTNKISSGLIGQTVASALGGKITEATYGNRVKNAVETLISMQTNKMIFSVITKLRTYNNMYLKSLQIPLNPDSGDSIEFTAQLYEIRAIDIEASIIEKTFNKDVGHTANKQQSDGNKQKDGAKEREKTPLMGIVDALKGRK